MGYESRWSGEVRIDPPLTWAEIKNSPVAFQDLKLRLDETVEDTATGQVRTVTAAAIVPLTTEAYNGYEIEEELTAFAEVHSATHTVAGRIQARSPDGDLWAYSVDGPSVTRIEPATVWLGDPVPPAIEQQVRDLVADEIHRADRPTFAEGERTDLIVSIMRNIHVHIASDGPDAPYWTPEPDRPLTHCSAGLLPIGPAPFEPCIEIGPHDNHRNAAGDTWTDDL
ncbi:hypothetical protein OIU81_03090 [Streptomyces sp. NBC_01454]|uniref:DUF6205 family protein n=1 Tax=Streptomyces sp. NBC_01454 TaxID=2975867 RepID=UPI002E36DBE6|nr:DUF6205 family protein [Streptomyces sp. NBC_01454]